MAKFDINTQTREYYKNLKKARGQKVMETDTGKFKRVGAENLFEFGVLEIRETVDKIMQAVDNVRERIEQQIEADVQSDSARANTKRTKLLGR